MTGNELLENLIIEKVKFNLLILQTDRRLTLKDRIEELVRRLMS